MVSGGQSSPMGPPKSGRRHIQSSGTSEGDRAVAWLKVRKEETVHRAGHC